MINSTRAFRFFTLLVLLGLALTTFASRGNARNTLPDAAGAPATATATADAFTVDDMLDVMNPGAYDLSDDGRFLALTVSSLRDRIGVDNYRFGDPTYNAPQKSDVLVVDTETGKSQSLFVDRRQARALHWSPDGNQLALLVLSGETFQPVIWDRASGKTVSIALPAGKYVAEASDLRWAPDGSYLLMALRSDEWRKKERERFEYETRGPIVVHSSKEPFLAWDELRRMPLARELAAYDLKTHSFRNILPETKISSDNISEDGSFITYLQDITRKTDYDFIGGADHQVEILPAAGGPARTVLKSTRGLNLIWSTDGRRYAYSKEGKIFFGSIDDKQPRQIAGEMPPPAKSDDKGKADPAIDSDKNADKDADKDPDKEKADKEKKEKERFTTVRLNANGSRLVASNKEGLWLIDTASAAKELFVKMPEEDKQSPRYEVLDWSPDGDNIYLGYSSRTKWERGFFRYNLKTRAIQELLKDGNIHSAFRLSKDGRRVVFTSASGNHPGDIYAADPDLKTLRRLTDLNPQLASKRLGKTELISYLDADGNRLNGVLYYPVDYEPGKKYPTVFNLYEQFFDDPFNGSINLLTASGYAVIQPSVTLETGYPGEAWVKGVTAAANKLIEMGIADPDRLGIMGQSYGGYAVNLLITQTNRFKAAINISGKVDMVSFYTDSPRLGVRNIHAPEKSQDRLGATLWQQPQKYIQQSAIMFADRIKTPLLLLTGEQDPNVPARQAMEMYYALRRLGRDVEWVSYTNGAHGMPTSTVAEVKDFHSRILHWWDDHLKGDPNKKNAD